MLNNLLLNHKSNIKIRKINYHHNLFPSPSNSTNKTKLIKANQRFNDEHDSNINERKENISPKKKNIEVFKIKLKKVENSDIKHISRSEFYLPNLFKPDKTLILNNKYITKNILKNIINKNKNREISINPISLNLENLSIERNTNNKGKDIFNQRINNYRRRLKYESYDYKYRKHINPNNSASISQILKLDKESYEKKNTNNRKYYYLDSMKKSKKNNLKNPFKSLQFPIKNINQKNYFNRSFFNLEKYKNYHYDFESKFDKYYY